MHRRYMLKCVPVYTDLKIKSPQFFWVFPSLKSILRNNLQKLKPNTFFLNVIERFWVFFYVDQLSIKTNSWFWFDSSGIMICAENNSSSGRLISACCVLVCGEKKQNAWKKFMTIERKIKSVFQMFVKSVISQTTSKQRGLRMMNRYKTN